LGSMQESIEIDVRLIINPINTFTLYSFNLLYLKTGYPQPVTDLNNMSILATLKLSILKPIDEKFVYSS